MHRKRRKAKRRKEGKKQQNSQKTTVKESERSKRESNRILEEHRKEIEAEMTELPKTRSDQDWGTEEEGDAIGAEIEKLKKHLERCKKGREAGPPPVWD